MYLGAILEIMLNISIHDICLKIANFKTTYVPPWATELLTIIKNAKFWFFPAWEITKVDTLNPEYKGFYFDDLPRAFWLNRTPNHINHWYMTPA